MILAVLLAAASTNNDQQTLIGGWSITCHNDSGAQDGKFDRCDFSKDDHGTVFTGSRDLTGLKLEATRAGCGIENFPSPSIITNEELSSLLGAQRFRMIESYYYGLTFRACANQKPPMSFGDAAIPALLSVTSNIRTKAK